MELPNMRAMLGAALGSTAMAATVLSYFYKEHAVLILAIQTAMIATIYSVGSIYIEHKMKEDYEDIIDHIESKLQAMNRNLYKAKIRISELESKLQIGKGRA